MRMRRYGVPEDDAALGTELFENTVDDRPERLLPRSRAAARPAEWIAPTQQVVLAGEGDARPAHPLVAGRFADRQHVGGGAFLQVLAQVGQPDCRPVGEVIAPYLLELVEGGPDGRPREIPEQGVECRRLVRIVQWSSPGWRPVPS